MNKKIKWIAILTIIIAIITLIFMLNKDDDYIEITETNPRSGTHSTNGDVKVTCSVKKDTSKKINFWVKNNSQVSVRISIDDKIHKTLAPGEDGDINTSPSFFKTNYNFRIGATPNGGNIDIEYEISLIDS